MEKQRSEEAAGAKKQRSRKLEKQSKELYIKAEQGKAEKQKGREAEKQRSRETEIKNKKQNRKKIIP